MFRLTLEKRQLVALEVIKILKSRSDSYPSDSVLYRNAPFHKAFLQGFEERFRESGINADTLLNVSSWIHGLNTSLGQSFFEPVAQILSNGTKKTFLGSEYRLFTEQNQIITEYMTDLKNGTKSPNVIFEDSMIQRSANGQMIDGSNFTADCFFEDDKKIVAIELKTVRPNSGQTRGEKDKILRAKAALRNYYSRIPECSGKKIYYYFGFPFDPTAATETGYDKNRFMGNMIEFSKFCSTGDILLAEELWSFLSGEQGTMEEVLNIIRDISTPSFPSEFEWLCSCHSIKNDCQRYQSIAQKWHLYDEVRIAKGCDRLMKTENREAVRYFNSAPFDENGKYNYHRSATLLKYLR